MQTWTYTSPNGVTETGPLSLAWYLDGVSMSDDYFFEEADAHVLFDRWAKKHAQGDDLLPIYWSVAEVGETAPYQVHEVLQGDNFFTAWSTPVDATTGNPVNWLALPVRDGRWRAGETTKGGFLQEATGWKPSALQPFVSYRALSAAAAANREAGE